MKKILLFGTFDVVHAGHIHMFKEAKEYADRLIVAVARDVNVEKIKSVGALHDEKERVDFLKHIDLIDRAVLGYKNDPYKIISEVKPDIIGLGYDQKVFVDKLADAITEMNLKIQIVRLQPYQKDRFKSSKIKKYIERIV
ncbi:MAG: adenylyltransferase/cytidyltransferase family protein [Candidatus Magasanikbacteria bacterium]|nr:adenylyltransferase/cytidyltransferase family protein [Candidatus Magasanikbacteria bacterium]